MEDCSCVFFCILSRDFCIVLFCLVCPVDVFYLILRVLIKFYFILRVLIGCFIYYVLYGRPLFYFHVLFYFPSSWPPIASHEVRSEIEVSLNPPPPPIKPPPPPQGLVNEVALPLHLCISELDYEARAINGRLITLTINYQRRIC